MLSSYTFNKLKPLFGLQYLKTKKNKVDTDLKSLPDQKLWDILRLCEIKGCELDEYFIEQVKQEIITRNNIQDA